MRISASYFGTERQEMVRFLPPTYDRVLEIGCGEGVFSRNLPKASERWGVEPDASAAAKARSAFDRVFVGTYEHVCTELPENYFDLVICNDVIEHMSDYDFFFASIKTKMKEGGYLVASVPNMRYYKVLCELFFKKDWQYRPQGIMDKSHLRFFTGKSLLRTLGEHGFKIKKFEGLNNAFPNITSLFALHKSIPLVLTLLFTLGYFRDILYVQFGFRVQKQEFLSKGLGG